MYDFTIIISSKNNIVPFNYEHDLHAFICKHISDVGYGSQVKKYIHSNMKESIPSKCKVPCGVWGKNGIIFYTDPCFTIRTNDLDVAQSIVRNIKIGMSVFKDFTVTDFMANKVDNLENKNCFATLYSSPILVADAYNKYKVIPLSEIGKVEEYLKDNVIRRAKLMNVELGDFDIKVAKQYKCCEIIPKKTDNINKAYKSIGRNFVLNITGSIQAKEFIYLNGLGRSLGLGFGFLNVK